MQSGKESSIRQKLGSLIRGASRTAPPSQKAYDELDRNTFFTADVLRELETSVPTPQRVRAMKELHEIVATKRLEEHAVQAIWRAISDLIDPSQPTDVRQATLTFTRSMISGQFHDLGALRAHFFHIVQSHAVKEDAQHRLEVLCALTEDGRNIQYMEGSIGPFLAQWMPEVVTFGSVVDVLSLLVNLVHYNAAYLDEQDLCSLVQVTCDLSRRSVQLDIIELCLELLNAVVCYSSLPSDALQSFVTTLCHTLNIERFSKKSLEIMLKLLGTHLGRSTIYTLCAHIQERSSSQDALQLRGAVFFISMSMWGIKRVESLELRFASVLPSLKLAVQSEHTIVVYEVALSLSRLVRRFSAQFHPLEWELAYDIMEAIQLHIGKLQQDAVGRSSNALVQVMGELWLCLEGMYKEGGNIGLPEKFFSLMEAASEALPVPSVLTLMAYRTETLRSSVYEPGWVDQVAAHMGKFYSQEQRSAVRTQAVVFLGTVLAEASATHEAALTENVLLPVLGRVSEDRDADTRTVAVQLLLDQLKDCSPTWAPHILAILSSILSRDLGKAVSEEDMKMADCKEAVFGLTQLFKTKLYSASPLASQIFSLLVDIVQQQYIHATFLPPACVMRVNIFSCILSLRSNEAARIGYQLQEGGSVHFSPFFVCSFPPSIRKGGTVESVVKPLLIDYHQAFAAVMACLKQEREWEVLVLVLHNLCGILEDRTITLAGLPDLSTLCMALCALVEEPRVSQLINVSSSWTRSDLSTFVHSVLSRLATYPAHLDRNAQLTLVCCLEAGLVGRGAHPCVSALSICTLELQATMTRLLPRVLYRLGQVAATPAMAVPVLDFLLGLIPVPSLYSDFVETEYLSVFAIAIPYTNPGRYSLYVVALAHHTVAMWFVQCRMQYRPSVARFIHKSLVAGQLSGSPQHVPECERGRVVSDLTEVCLDMMARYTYSSLSSLPSRSQGADLLVAGGPSKTWLVGHTLVTITTSGRGGGVPRACQRCAAMGRMGRPMDPRVGASGEDPVLCSCWCRGWAEVKIRRPTGNVSWLLRLQNRLQPLFSLSDTDYSLLTANYPFQDTPLHGNLREGQEEEDREEGGKEEEEERKGAEEKEREGEEGDAQGDVKAETTGDEVAEEDGGGPLDHVAAPEETCRSVVSQATMVGGTGALDTTHAPDLTEPVPIGAHPVPSRRQPTSLSWSETGEGYQLPLSPRAASYSCLEHLPPLLSYDEEDSLGRSPSLRGPEEVMSEEEQLTLVASTVSQHSSGESTGSLTSEDEPPLQEAEENVEPELEQLELVETTPTLPTLPPVQLQPGKSPPPRPVPSHAPTESPAVGRKKILFTPTTRDHTGVGREEGEVYNDPSFIFLQLYHSPLVSSPLAPDQPLRLPSGETMDRALKVLDHIPPYDTHKIGVIYVGTDQTQEHQILSNTLTSSRYLEFLRGLGQLLCLADCPSEGVYLGGLDRSGTDGQFAYFYQDHVTQVIFHVATLMPTHPTDPQCSNKKLHIGNNFVTIVYNDSQQPYAFGTIKGQFNFVEVLIEPLAGGMNRLSVRTKRGLPDFPQSDTCLISDSWLPVLSRHKALQANLASLVHVSESGSIYGGSEQYPSNWLGRLRCLRRIQEKCLSDKNVTSHQTSSPFCDFTEYS